MDCPKNEAALLRDFATAKKYLVRTTLNKLTQFVPDMLGAVPRPPLRPFLWDIDQRENSVSPHKGGWGHVARAHAVRRLALQPLLLGHQSSHRPPMTQWPQWLLHCRVPRGLVARGFPLLLGQRIAPSAFRRHSASCDRRTSSFRRSAVSFARPLPTPRYPRSWRRRLQYAEILVIGGGGGGGSFFRVQTSVCRPYSRVCTSPLSRRHPVPLLSQQDSIFGWGCSWPARFGVCVWAIRINPFRANYLGCSPVVGTIHSNSKYSVPKRDCSP